LHGWAVGDGGIVLRTINGGASWGKGVSNVEEDLLAVTFRQREGRLCSRIERMIVRSDSAGAYWEQIESGTRKLP
jgi:photosystem II stability/assembly factor-like uncharacterized protein